MSGQPEILDVCVPDDRPSIGIILFYLEIFPCGERSNRPWLG